MLLRGTRTLNQSITIQNPDMSMCENNYVLECQKRTMFQYIEVRSTAEMNKRAKEGWRLISAFNLYDSMYAIMERMAP